MMDHNNIQELLSAYANNELAQTQREFVEEHLPDCPECQAELNDYRWVRSTVGLLAAAPAEANITELTMSRIQTANTTQSGINPNGIIATLGLQRMLRPALVVAVLAAVVIIPLALQLTGGGPGVGIASAYAATKALESFRMSGTTVMTANGQSVESTFEWDFQAPDLYRGKLGTPSGAEEFILLGEEQYMQASAVSDGFTVIAMDNFSVFNPIPNSASTLQILDSLVEAEELMDGGPGLTHFRGRVDIDRIIDEQLSAIPQDSPDYGAIKQVMDVQRTAIIDVELWLDNDDSTIRQMKLNVEAPTIVSDQSGTRQEGSISYATTVEFFDLNAPIRIERPVTASGELEAGWIRTQ